MINPPFHISKFTFTSLQVLFEKLSTLITKENKTENTLLLYKFLDESIDMFKSGLDVKAFIKQFYNIILRLSLVHNNKPQWKRIQQFGLGLISDSHHLNNKF